MHIKKWNDTLSDFTVDYLIFAGSNINLLGASLRSIVLDIWLLCEYYYPTVLLSLWQGKITEGLNFYTTPRWSCDAVTVLITALGPVVGLSINLAFSS